MSFRGLSKSGLWAIPIYISIVVFLTLLVYRPIDNIAHDLMISAASPFSKPADDIVIVTITEETLGQFPYRSPLDREFVSELISTIARGKPRVIAIDLLFDQPTEAGKDQRLASILRSSEVPIIVATADIEDGLSAQQFDYLKSLVPETSRAPARLLRDRTDGVVRQLFIGQKSADKFNEGFSAAIAIASGATSPARQPQDLIYYVDAASQPFKFTTYPAHTVSLIPTNWFFGKIVMIGVDLPFEDRHLTPFVTLNGTRDGSLSGVVIHAHGLSQILNGDQIVRLGVPATAAISLIILSLSTWLIWKPAPTLLKPLVALSGLVCLWLIAAVLFSNFSVLMPVAVPSITILSMSSLVAFAAWKRDRGEKEFVEQAFSRYVNPTVVKIIVEQPKNLKLGGERRFITCISTDLTDFTQFCEKLEPEQVAETLNQYLGKVCELFTEHEATIDKVVGDAVVGFFGAPIAQPKQADRAIKLALAIDRFSEQFCEKMERDDQNFGSTRIGVHSGLAVVGNFGGERFFDYTAVGDTANTAARLEGANKRLCTTICISEAVAEGATTDGNLRPSGTIQLAGKADLIQVYEALQPEDTRPDVIEQYLEAYAAMRNGEAKSKEMFDKLSELVPADRLVAYHCRRLQAGASDDKVLLEVN